MFNPETVDLINTIGAYAFGVACVIGVIAVFVDWLTRRPE